MNETRDLLVRARQEAPVVEPDLHALYARRDARATRKKATTIVVALAIGLGSVGIGFASVGGTGSRLSPASGDPVGAPSQDLSLGEGDYYSMRVDAGYATYETWWALDDSGRIATIDKCCGYGRDEGTFGPGEFSSDSGPVEYLSTDPTELEQQLRERVEPGGASPEPYADWGDSGGPVEWGLIRSIHELLEAPDVTPAQKAALFQVAAGLNGVTADATAKDPFGRPAILLSTETEGALHQWYFDPESEQLLVEVDGGGVTYRVLAAGVTSAIDDSSLDRSFLPLIDE